MSQERIAKLRDRLGRLRDAKDMAATSVWADAWESFERELLERLLKCGPEDEMPRYKLQVAIEAARQVRRAIENEGSGEAVLLKELDILEGRKGAPIA